MLESTVLEPMSLIATVKPFLTLLSALQAMESLKHILQAIVSQDRIFL